MERIFYKPEKIKQLEAQLNAGNKEALELFWKDIKIKSNPIVEDIDNDEKYKIVTIVFREKKKLNNVVLIPPVGMRKLEQCIMEKLPQSDLWYISYKVRNDVCFTYEFSCNDPLNNDWNRRWKNVVTDEFNSNKLKHVDKENKRERLIPYVKMEKAKERKFINKQENINYGTINEHKIFSSILNEEKKYWVYTPYGYKKDKSYGVIVLNDGERYIESLNGINVMDNIIYEKKIPESIVVFIDTSVNRTEYLQCSNEYADFIGSELISEVKKNYNISSDKKKNVIGGFSLGGLFASYMALKYSSIFGNVLSQSGSYWYKRKEYHNKDLLWISSLFKDCHNKELKFYINVGLIEPKASMKDTNIKFSEDLISMGYDVIFEYFGSGHDHIYWGETLGDGLIKLL